MTISSGSAAEKTLPADNNVNLTTEKNADHLIEHVHYDRGSNRPAPSLGFFSDAYRQLCRLFLKVTGWKVEGDWPAIDKMVLIAAPHTSNWDGIYMLAAAGYYRIPLRWMGKASLTTGPFGGFVKWLGCVPVDRSQAQDIVPQMMEAFANTDAMVLAVPPEGTRAKTKGWKTGFYRIAVGANVPIVFSVLDFGARTIRVSGHIRPSGDYEKDLPVIMTHYAGAKGLRVDQFDAKTPLR